MNTIQITVTDEEANTVLAALGAKPYVEVAGLVQKVLMQAQAQIAERNKTDEPAPEQAKTGRGPRAVQ